MMPRSPLLQSNLGPPTNVQIKTSQDAEEKSTQNWDWKKPLRSERCIKANFAAGSENLSRKAQQCNWHHHQKSETRNSSGRKIGKDFHRKVKINSLPSENAFLLSKLDLSGLEQDDIKNNNNKTKLVLSMRQSNVLLSPRVYDTVSISPNEKKHYANEDFCLRKSRSIQQVTLGPIESECVCDIFFPVQPNAENVVGSSARDISQSQKTNHSKSLRKNAIGNGFSTNCRQSYQNSFNRRRSSLARKKTNLLKKDSLSSGYYTDLFDKPEAHISNVSRQINEPLTDFSAQPEGYLSRTDTMDQISGRTENIAKQLHEADLEHLINQQFFEGLKTSGSSFFDEPSIYDQHSNFEQHVPRKQVIGVNSEPYSVLSDTNSSVEFENLSDSLRVSELDDLLSLNTDSPKHNDNALIGFGDHLRYQTGSFIDTECRKKVHFKLPVSSSEDLLSLDDLGFDTDSDVGVKQNIKAENLPLLGETRNAKNDTVTKQNVSPNSSCIPNVPLKQKPCCKHPEMKVDLLSSKIHSSVEPFTLQQSSHHSVDDYGSHSLGISSMGNQLKRNSTRVPGLLTTSVHTTKSNFSRMTRKSKKIPERVGKPSKHLSSTSVSSDQTEVLRQLRIEKLVDESSQYDKCYILLKARYFRIWQKNVRLLKIIKNKENLKILKAVSFYSLTTTMKCFLAWRTVSRKNEMMAGLLCRHHLMKKGFVALLWSVRARKLKRERVYLGKRKLKFTKFFKKWCTRYQERRFERVKIFFYHWRLEFRNKVIVDMFDKRRKSLVSLQMFFFWKEKFHQSTHSRIAVDHYNNLAMKKAWQLWKIFTAEKAVAKSQTEVAEIKHDTWAMLRCMRRWNQTTVQTQYVKIYCNRKVVSHFMAEWKHSTSLAKICHQKEIFSAQNLGRRYLVRHHFSIWKQELKMKGFLDGKNKKIARRFVIIWKSQLQRHRMICAEIQSHHNHTTKKLSFSALREYAKYCQTKRVQAVQLLKIFPVRRFMSSWHQYTREKNTFRKKQEDFKFCHTKKKLHTSFGKWRLKLKGILDQQKKQHQWTLHCTRKAADKWLHLLKLKQNETTCENLILKFGISRVKRGFGVWKKCIQAEEALCERAHTCKILLLRIKMRKILRYWNVRAQESLTLRPVIEKINRKRIARYFDAFALIRNRQILKHGMIAKIHSNHLRQCLDKWKGRLNEKNRMEAFRNQYHVLLLKRVFNGWIKYVSRCRSYELLLKQHDYSLLQQTFYIWATTTASRQIRASKVLHYEYVRRSNAQYIFQSWRSAAKHKLENEEKDVLFFRKQHDLAIKRSMFGSWASNLMKHKKARKFMSKNTEQRLKTLLLSWHFITTENLVKKMERFNSSIKLSRKQEFRSTSKAIQSEQCVSDAVIQTDDLSESESYSCSTCQSFLSQSLSAMSETVSGAYDTDIPDGVSVSNQRINSSDTSSVNSETRINGYTDSGILLRSSADSSIRYDANSLYLKDASVHCDDLLIPRGISESAVDSKKLHVDHSIIESEFPSVDICQSHSDTNTELNLSSSSEESSESNLITVRDLRVSGDIENVQDETKPGCSVFMPDIISNLNPELKELQNQVKASALSLQKNSEIELTNQDSEPNWSTATSHDDPFYRPILQDFSHMAGLPIHEQNQASVLKKVHQLDGGVEEIKQSSTDVEILPHLISEKLDNVDAYSRNKLPCDILKREAGLQQSSYENRQNFIVKDTQNSKEDETITTTPIACYLNLDMDEENTKRLEVIHIGHNSQITPLEHEVEVTTSSLSEDVSEISSSFLSSDEDVDVICFDDDVVNTAKTEKLRPMLPIHLYMQDSDISTTEWLVRLAVVRMYNRPLAFTFHQWRLFVIGKKWDNKMVTHMRQRCDSLTMRKHLRIWRRNYSYSLSSKKLYVHGLLNHCFLPWLMWSKHKQNEKRLKQFFEQKCSKNLMKSTFKNWNLRLQRRNALLEILKYWQTKTIQHFSPRPKDEKTQEKIKNEMKLDCFTQWKLQTDQMRAADRHHKRTVLMRFLTVWNDWTSEKVALAKRCKKIFEYRMKKKVLKSWMVHVVFMENINMMNRRAKKDFLSQLLSRWHKITQVRQVHSRALLQLTLTNRINTTGVCFGKWHQEQTKHKLADVMYRRCLMKKLIMAWSGITKELIDIKLRNKAIGILVAENSKNIVFKIWRNEFQLTCKMNSASLHLSLLTVRSTWYAWKDVVVKQRAMRCHSMFLKRRIFHCWKKFMQSKQNSDKRARTVLSLWHRMTKKNQELSCMADQFVSQAHTIKLEIFFTTWLIASDQTKRAKNHCRNMILARAFSALHEKSSKKKKLMRMQNNFMKQKTKELFAISWHKWKHHHRTKLRNLTSIEKHKTDTECRILRSQWLLWKQRTLEINSTQTYNRSLTKKFFTKWNVSNKKFKKADDLGRDHVERKLKMILTQWWSRTQSMKNEHQIIFALKESRNRIATISIFMTWLKSSRNRMIARSYWEKKRKNTAFQCLKNWKKESKRLKICFDMAVQLVQTTMLKFYFKQWKSMFRRTRMLEVTCDRMIEVKNNSKLKHFWKKWLGAKEKNDMCLRHKHCLAVDAIKKWKKYASNRVNERKEKERRRELIEHFKKKWLCKRMFNIWKMKHKVQFFHSKFKTISLINNWNCWKTRTASIIFARELNKTWTLKKWWYCWRMEYVSKLVTKDSVERINRDLVISIFRIWRAYRYKKKTGRRYQGMTEEVLTPRKRSKIPVLRKHRNVDY